MSGDGMGRRVHAVLCAWTLRRVSNGMLLLSLAAVGVCAGAQTAVDGAIRGDVKSADGNALARTEVSIDLIEGKNVRETYATGADGTFAFEGLAAGRYQLSAKRRG